MPSARSEGCSDQPLTSGDWIVDESRSFSSGGVYWVEVRRPSLRRQFPNLSGTGISREASTTTKVSKRSAVQVLARACLHVIRCGLVVGSPHRFASSTCSLETLLLRIDSGGVLKLFHVPWRPVHDSDRDRWRGLHRDEYRTSSPCLYLDLLTLFKHEEWIRGARGSQPSGFYGSPRWISFLRQRDSTVAWSATQRAVRMSDTILCGYIL